jgi:diguanylate cyclase (GGDEF)-like protein
VHSPADAHFARLELARDELAKAWLRGIIDGTPLDEVGQLPVEWMAREAPALIADILGELNATAVEPGGATAAQARLAELSRLRSPPEAIHRDLAALHALLIGSLRDEARDRERFARAAGRLAEIFGSIQAALGQALLGEGGDARREFTGLGGTGELHNSLRRLVAGYQRYGHPFAVLSIDIEGLGRVNEAYGRETGDRIIEGAAATLVQQIREVDHAFRLADDDFCILAPHQSAKGVRPLADRLRSSVAGSVAPEAPRPSLAIGIASCPEHGESAVQLLDAAQEATYAAKATGHGIAISNGIDISSRDRSARRS